MKYAITGLVLLLAGCAMKQPIEGRADLYIPAQVNLTSADLQGRTAFSPPMLVRRNGILYVTVPVRAASDLNLLVDYRYTFLNEQGMPIYQSSWMAKTLASRVWTEIAFNSMTADASDFRMDLRYSQ